MKHYKSVDIVRAVAILMILFYHAYVLTGNPYGGLFLNRYLILGGEIGVTLFFLISGFGISLSLASDDRKGVLTYKSFLFRRVSRILPQYYVCCAVLLLFSNQAALLSRDGVKHIVTHALLIHNLWPSTNGSINGALWTMGTVFQFYLIVPLLYRIMKRRPVLVLLGALGVSVLSKYLIYHFGLAPKEEASVIYFIYGRQLLSALDNFVSGMFLAQLLTGMRQRNVRESWWYIVPCGVGAATLIGWCQPISHTGLYGDFLLAYVWHSGLALILMFTVFCFAMLPLRYESRLAKGLLFVSKNQYGIYLWHMPLLNTLLDYSGWMQFLLGHSFAASFIFFLTLAIAAGRLSTKLIDERKKAPV